MIKVLLPSRIHKPAAATTSASETHSRVGWDSMRGSSCDPDSPPRKASTITARRILMEYAAPNRCSPYAVVAVAIDPSPPKCGGPSDDTAACCGNARCKRSPKLITTVIACSPEPVGASPQATLFCPHRICYNSTWMESDHNRIVQQVCGWIPLIALPAIAIAFGRLLEPWAFMWSLSFALFFGLKWVTWQARSKTVHNAWRS